MYWHCREAQNIIRRSLLKIDNTVIKIIEVTISVFIIFVRLRTFDHICTGLLFFLRVNKSEVGR